MSGVSGLEVTGGVTGVEVQLDDLLLGASVLADAGAELAAVGAATALVAGSADLLESAVVDPVGAARVSAALAAALLGPRGVAATAVGVELRAGRLTLAVARYRAADALAARTRELRHWLQGSAAALALPAVAAGGGVWWLARSATGGDPVADVEAFLLAHPGVVDDVAAGVPTAVATVATGLLGPLAGPADAALRAHTGRALLPRSLADSAALLALLYADALPGVEPVATVPAHRPRHVGDLVRGLSTADQRASGRAQGDIVVSRVVHRPPVDGAGAAYVVWLPGTKDWQADPGRRTHVNDLASSLELMAGEPNARVAAVGLALQQAGARPGEPVMLVGHSQGGMVALRAADQLAGRYDVTHVLTAGSPVGGMPVPDGVQVLSLENRQDVVPRLDGAANRPAAGHVTALFDARAASLGREHALREVYVPAAQHLAGSDDPAVAAWTRSAQAFLDGDGRAPRGTATTFRVLVADAGR